MKITGRIDFDSLLQNIPAGQEREDAAISLDKFLGIPHIPTEGFNKLSEAPPSSDFIVSGGGAWFSPSRKFYLLDGSHEQFVRENAQLFNIPSEASGDDLVALALIKGWVRIRGENPNINLEICAGDKCISRLAQVASYLVNEAGHNPVSVVDLDIFNPSNWKGHSVRCSLQDLIQETVSIPSYLTSATRLLWKDSL